MKHLKKFNENTHTDSNLTFKLSVPSNVYNILKNKGIKESKIIEAYKEYIMYSLGISTGTDLNQFELWCQNEDNLVDFIDETTFTTLSKEEKEKMMSDAIRMSEKEWMTKYKVGDHGDYLNMARSRYKIESVGLSSADEYIKTLLSKFGLEYEEDVHDDDGNLCIKAEFSDDNEDYIFYISASHPDKESATYNIKLLVNGQIEDKFSTADLESSMEFFFRSVGYSY